MSELSEYTLPDGTTVQLTEEDAKNYPGARKAGTVREPKEQPRDPKQQQTHEPVRNRARNQ